MFPLFFAACATTPGDSVTPPKTDDTVDTAVDSADTAPVDSGDSAVDADGDGSPAGDDCNDDDAAIHPGADEVCDGVDQDCDGAPDDDPVDGTSGYVDADGDGLGAGDLVTRCDGSGLVAEACDCDDADATVARDPFSCPIPSVSAGTAWTMGECGALTDVTANLATGGTTFADDTVLVIGDGAWPGGVSFGARARIAGMGAGVTTLDDVSLYVAGDAVVEALTLDGGGNDALVFGGGSTTFDGLLVTHLTGSGPGTTVLHTSGDLAVMDSILTDLSVSDVSTGTEVLGLVAVDGSLTATRSTFQAWTASLTGDTRPILSAYLFKIAGELVAEDSTFDQLHLHAEASSGSAVGAFGAPVLVYGNATLTRTVLSDLSDDITMVEGDTGVEVYRELAGEGFVAGGDLTLVDSWVRGITWSASGSADGGWDDVQSGGAVAVQGSVTCSGTGGIVDNAAGDAALSWDPIEPDATITWTGCDFGEPGVDDNSPTDLTGPIGGDWGDGVTFTCTQAGCE